jgi:hypothetical protein
MSSSSIKTTKTSTSVADCVLSCGVDPASCSLPTGQMPGGAGAYAAGSGGVDGTYGAAGPDGIYQRHAGWDTDPDGGDPHGMFALDISTGNYGQLGKQQFANFNVIKDKGGGFADAADALKFASYGNFAYQNVALDRFTGRDYGSQADARGLAALEARARGAPQLGTEQAAAQQAIAQQVQATKDVSTAVATDTHSACQSAADPHVCHLQAILTELQQLEALLSITGHTDKAKSVSDTADSMVKQVQTHLDNGVPTKAAIADAAAKLAQ